MYTFFFVEHTLVGVRGPDGIVFVPLNPDGFTMFPHATGRLAAKYGGNKIQKMHNNDFVICSLETVIDHSYIQETI